MDFLGRAGQRNAMWRYNLGTKRANDPIGGSKRTCGLPPPISLPCLGLKNLAAKPRLYWFSVGGSPEPPPSPELRHRFSQVADFTAELFPGEMRVEVTIRKSSTIFSSGSELTRQARSTTSRRETMNGTRVCAGCRSGFPACFASPSQSSSGAVYEEVLILARYR
jgi:hypothetical protein